MLFAEKDLRMLTAARNASSGADLEIAPYSISTIPGITGPIRFNTLHSTHDPELLEYLDSKSISTTYLSRLDGHINDQIREDQPGLWNTSCSSRRPPLSVYMNGRPLEIYKYASITCKDIAHYTRGFIPVLRHGQGENSAINQIMEVINSCGEIWKLAYSHDEELLTFVSVYEISLDYLREIDKKIETILEEFRTGHALTNANGVKILELAFGANPLDVLKYALFHYESPQLGIEQASREQMLDDQGHSESSGQSGTEVRYVNNDEHDDASESLWGDNPSDTIFAELLALSPDRLSNLGNRPPEFLITRRKTAKKCSKRRQQKAAERAKTVSMVDPRTDITNYSTDESVMDGIEETNRNSSSGWFP